MPLTPPRDLAGWIIWLIAVIAICAVLWVAIQYLNIPVPPWVSTIIGIVLLACLAIWAVRTISEA